MSSPGRKGKLRPAVLALADREARRRVQLSVAEDGDASFVLRAEDGRPLVR